MAEPGLQAVQTTGQLWPRGGGGGGGLDQATADTLYVNVTGDSMSGQLTTPKVLLNDVADQSLKFSAGPYVAADTVTGDLVIGSQGGDAGFKNVIAQTGLLRAPMMQANSVIVTNAPTNGTHAANKTYVDGLLAPLVARIEELEARLGG